MKRILLIALATMFLSSGALAQDWTFAGIRVHTGKDTINKVPRQYGYSWLRRDKDYSANKKLFKVAAKDAYKSDDTYIDFTFKSSKTHNFVAIYNIQYLAGLWKGSKKKQVSSFKFYAGKDEASINKQVTKDSQTYKNVGVQLVELLDLAQKKNELNQQAENPVLGRAVE